MTQTELYVRERTRSAARYRRWMRVYKSEARRIMRERNGDSVRAALESAGNMAWNRAFELRAAREAA